jgi:hypothetical protein
MFYSPICTVLDLSYALDLIPQTAFHVARITPPSTSHKRALSSAEEPSPKKHTSSNHSTTLNRVPEMDPATASTTNVHALWRQIPIAKPIKHSEVYCLDLDCDKHGKKIPSLPSGENKIQHAPKADDTHQAGALPARTAQHPSRSMVKI